MMHFHCCCFYNDCSHMLTEPVYEKTNNLVIPSQTALTQTGRCSQRSRLEAGNFRFKKKRGYTICVAKTKTLISCAVDLRLCFHICRLLVFSCTGSNNKLFILFEAILRVSLNATISKDILQPILGYL